MIIDSETLIFVQAGRAAGEVSRGFGGSGKGMGG